MILHLETTSGVPIYRQVCDQISAQVASGRLTVGQRIPSVRELAKTLAVNPMTISKAYSELEREGTIEIRRGVGTFVARNVPRLTSAERTRLLRQIAERLAIEAKRLDVPHERVVEIVGAALRRYPRNEDERNTRRLRARTS